MNQSSGSEEKTLFTRYTQYSKYVHSSSEIRSFNHGCCICAKVREGKAWYNKKFISRPASDRNLRLLRGPEHELELRECRKTSFHQVNQLLLGIFMNSKYRNFHDFFGTNVNFQSTRTYFQVENSCLKQSEGKNKKLGSGLLTTLGLKVHCGLVLSVLTFSIPFF